MTTITLPEPESVSAQQPTPNEPPAPPAAKRPRFNWVFLGMMAVGLLLSAGIVALKLLEPELQFRKLRAADFDARNYEMFVEKYPNFKYIGDVDDMLWNHAKTDTFDTGTWQLYRRLFPNGRHTADLDKLFAAHQAEELEFLRTHPGVELAADYLKAHPDSPETMEVRELLLKIFETNRARTQASPPTTVIRRLLQSARDNVIAYDADDNHDAWVVVERLSNFFGKLGLRLESDPSGAAIHIRADRTEDESNPLSPENDPDLKVPSQKVKASIRIQFSGDAKPVWTGSIEAATPEQVQFRADISDEMMLKEAVDKETTAELEAAAEGVFRYWWPEPEIHYWRGFREFQAWLRHGKHPETEVLDQLAGMSLNGVSDKTLKDLHAALTDSYEFLKTIDDSNQPLQNLRKAAQFKLRIGRLMSTAEAKFGPFE